ncbi:hypothetical protein GCM10010206_61690 [Streptomyces cinerochromogenes]|nr:hypothetical protein GCM10010206_61690 [Streptomyces cinerochromogenes]
MTDGRGWPLDRDDVPGLARRLGTIPADAGSRLTDLHSYRSGGAHALVCAPDTARARLALDALSRQVGDAAGWCSAVDAGVESVVVLPVQPVQPVQPVRERCLSFSV